jgi:hypothetical protein
MNDFLKELYASHVMSETSQKDKTERELVEKMCEIEAALLQALSKSQKELFEEYKASLDELHLHTEEIAFCRGVRITAQFFTEALTSKSK